MAWCEANRADHPFGLARNQRLPSAHRQTHEGQFRHQDTAKPRVSLPIFNTRHTKAGPTCAAL